MRIINNKKILIISIIIVLCLVIALPVIFISGKDASEYTWKKYQRLSEEEKAEFPDRFDSMDEYNEWYENAKSDYEQKNPNANDDKTGNAPTINTKKKDVSEYTWEDYQKLSEDEKAVFPDYFESMDAYREWYNQVTKEDGMSIDLGDKAADEYTWEDYQKLSEDERAVFPDYFDSMDAYYKWYDSVKPAD